MAAGHGVGTIDFGAAPGNSEASVVVTGLTGISATSKVEPYVMADDTTSDHTAEDHRWLLELASFSCGTPSGTSCPVYAKSIQGQLEGTFKIRLVWAD